MCGVKISAHQIALREICTKVTQNYENSAHTPRSARCVLCVLCGSDVVKPKLWQWKPTSSLVVVSLTSLWSHLNSRECRFRFARKYRVHHHNARLLAIVTFSHSFDEEVTHSYILELIVHYMHIHRDKKKWFDDGEVSAASRSMWVVSILAVSGLQIANQVNWQSRLMVRNVKQRPSRSTMTRSKRKGKMHIK